VAGEKIRDAQSTDAGEGVLCVGSLLMHERNLTPLDGHDRAAPFSKLQHMTWRRECDRPS
jgi:hypothetical protein